MSIYLIDFENVHYDGLSGILNLTAEDEVYIFYSDNGKRLTFELHEQIINSPAKFYYYKAAVGGKNALDHQLSSYLGFLVGKKDEKKYFIVSKDQGFRHLVTFWKSANLNLEVTLVDSIKISKQGKNNGTDQLPAEEDLSNPVVESESAVINTEKKSSSKLASRRRGRQTKVTTEAEKPLNKNEHTLIQGAHKQSADIEAKQIQVENIPNEPLKNIEEIKTGKKEDAEREKTPPEVIEFILPQEIISCGKPGKKAVNIGDNQEKISAKEPNLPSETVKPVKVKPGIVKIGELPKQVIGDSAEKVREKTVIEEEDIIRIIPEAKEQGWLNDITRYVNTSKGKADLYNKIRRRLGQEQGRKIYNLLKKLI